MSDEAQGPDAPSPGANQAAAGEPVRARAPVHGGELLREAREAAGLHIAALAVSLKVPVRQIESLEQGAFDRLPDPTFVRALAASICRQLRIDPKPVLDELPQNRGLSPRVGDGLNEPFQRPGSSNGGGAGRFVPRPPVLIAIALLLAALALFVLPPLLQDEGAGGVDDAAPAAVVPPPADAASAAAEAGTAESAASSVAPSASAAAAAAAAASTPSMRGMVVESVQPLPLPAAPGASPASQAVPPSAPLTGRKP